MSDPREPILSAPPAEPVDVPTYPDSPPREPFDVPVYPSQGPREPFDVPTYPDLPPTEPFDVATYPDRAPVGTFDVPIAVDGPPRDPIDVAVSPDRPPIAPFDVPTTSDLPPAIPFDVPTSPDSPPAAPFNVGTVLDAPPGVPFDVATSPDAPPATPFDVPTYPDLPAVQIPGSRDGRAPTIDQIVDSVIDFDRTLGTFLAGIVEIEPISLSGPGAGALDPFTLARWLRDYTNVVGGGGLARFISEQSVLYAMNPVTARIFDPTYFLKMLVPGSMGHVMTTVDVEGGLTMQTVARLRDAELQVKVNANPEKPGGNGLSDRPDQFGPENKFTDGQAFSVDSIVDGALGGTPNPYAGVGDAQGGIVTKFDASSFFESRDSTGGTAVKATAKARAAAGIENVMSSKLAASNAVDGIIRVGIPGELDDGSVLSNTQDPSEVVDDDDARVPISFTDLRQVPGKKFRSVYFRPENLTFSMGFAPEYSEASAFGRVDPVVGYQRTVRTLNVAFEVHAFAPEDLQVMYNKMVWLESMVYPTYGVDSLMKSGPVVRLRIGDAVSTDLGGVPGVIRSLSFDFADALWELRRGMKVPRMYKVAVDYLVLHDGPVGTVNGVFGVFQMPPAGTAPNKLTNYSDAPLDSRTEKSEGVTVLPGRFSRFGEPRK